MRHEITNLRDLLMVRNGQDPRFPNVPRFHSPVEQTVRGIIEAHPCPVARQAYVGKVLIETAPELAEGIARSAIAKENRLASNPNEVAKLDLSHVVIRGE